MRTSKSSSVFNLGYGFDANDEDMTTLVTLTSATFVELAFEVVVDMMALNIELQHGVELERFWNLWQMNGVAFFFLRVFDSLISVSHSLLHCNKMVKRCATHCTILRTLK